MEIRLVRADLPDVEPVLEQAAEASARTSAIKTTERFVMIGPAPWGRDGLDLAAKAALAFVAGVRTLCAGEE